MSFDNVIVQKAIMFPEDHVTEVALGTKALVT